MIRSAVLFSLCLTGVAACGAGPQDLPGPSTVTLPDPSSRAPLPTAVPPLDALHDAREGDAALEAAADSWAGRASVLDQEVGRGVLQFVATLVTCPADGRATGFDALARVEGRALASERAALGDALEQGGPELRADLLESGALASAVVDNRRALAARLAVGLPTWAQAHPDRERALAARRAMVGLDLARRAEALRVEAALDQFEAELTALDMGAAGAGDRFAAALAPVDEALVEAQRARVEALVGACGLLDEQTWLGLLEQGEVVSYVGRLGPAPRASARPGSGAASSPHAGANLEDAEKTDVPIP